MHSNSLANVMAAVLTLAFSASTAISQVDPHGQTAPKNTEEGKPTVRTDALGDPLPPRAIARLGTRRLRGCGGPVVFSPDGKYIVTTGGTDASQAVFWDRGSGQPVKAFRAREGILRLVFSTDGKKLAAVGNGGFFNPVWDADNGKELFTFKGKQVAFCAERKELVSTYSIDKDCKVRTFDAGTGRQLTEWELPHTSDEGRLVLSPDGRFASFSREQAKGWMLVIFDLAKRAQVKSLHSPQDRIGPIGFSSDGLRLIVGGKQGVGIWEWSHNKGPRHWAGAIPITAALSSDGRRLAWISMNEVRVFSLWTADVESGRSHRLRALMFDTHYSSHLPNFSPDGKSIAVVSEGSAAVLFDSRTGREQLPLAAHEGRIWRVQYSPAGQHVMTRDSHRLLVWEAATGRLLHRLPDDLPAGETVLLNTLSRGRIVTAALADGTFHLRDAAAAKELRQLEGKDGYYLGAVGDVSAVTADGRYAAICGPVGIRIYDLETGAIRCQFQRDYPVWGMTFTEDGRILEVTMQDFQKGLLPRFYDAHTGREVEAPAEAVWRKSLGGRWYGSDDDRAKHRLRELNLLDASGQPAFTGKDGLFTDIYESPGSRYLAVQGRTGLPHVISEKDRRFVRLWDTVTRRLILELDEKHQIGGFSPDGRTFVSTEFPTGAIHLWEIAIGRERLRLAGHISGDVAIGFRPDGRALVSGGADTQVFLWDATGRALDGIRHEAQHSPQRLRQLWQALVGDDAAEAYRAIWAFVEAPGQTVDWMRDQLSSIAPVERRQLMRLIADLDSDEFAVRKKASEELERLGELADPALRDALAAKPSLECRRRCEDLLAKLAVLSSHRLRAVRAVEALEHIATAEARNLLEKLSRGAPEARQTQEAKAALKRLQQIKLGRDR